MPSQRTRLGYLDHGPRLRDPECGRRSSWRKRATCSNSSPRSDPKASVSSEGTPGLNWTHRGLPHHHRGSIAVIAGLRKNDHHTPGSRRTVWLPGDTPAGGIVKSATLRSTFLSPNRQPLLRSSHWSPSHPAGEGPTLGQPFLQKRGPRRGLRPRVLLVLSEYASMASRLVS